MAKMTNNVVKEGKFKDENIFYTAIAPVLALAQIFGLLPIVEIFSKNYDNIKFRFLSFRTLHSIVWTICAIFFLYLELRRVMKEETLNPKTIGGIVFYSLGIASSIFFIRVALKWNELLQIFKEVEDIFCNDPYTLSGWSLKKRIHFATWIMMIFALLEHLFSWYSYLNDRFIQADECNWQIDSWFYYLTSLHLGHVYKAFDVNLFSVSWAEYMNISLTFTWNFVDLFIIIMSLSIATKFKMLNERLEFFRGRITIEAFWDEVRCHYNKVCELNEFIDDILGSLICVACLSDLYYVCVQLLNVATPLPFLANKIYFWYSTIFLICRTAAMFLVAASVNDESIKPLAIFRTIPSEGWYQQVQRLCNQIQLSGVALSGKNFFFLTRGIVISIAGTIVTYELVLLQFDGEKILSGMFNPCGILLNNTNMENNKNLTYLQFHSQ